MATNKITSASRSQSRICRAYLGHRGGVDINRTMYMYKNFLCLFVKKQIGNYMGAYLCPEKEIVKERWIERYKDRKIDTKI